MYVCFVNIMKFLSPTGAVATITGVCARGGDNTAPADDGDVSTNPIVNNRNPPLHDDDDVLVLNKSHAGVSLPIVKQTGVDIASSDGEEDVSIINDTSLYETSQPEVDIVILEQLRADTVAAGAATSVPTDEQTCDDIACNDSEEDVSIINSMLYEIPIPQPDIVNLEDKEDLYCDLCNSFESAQRITASWNNPPLKKCTCRDSTNSKNGEGDDLFVNMELENVDVDHGGDTGDDDNIMYIGKGDEGGITLDNNVDNVGEEILSNTLDDDANDDNDDSMLNNAYDCIMEGVNDSNELMNVDLDNLLRDYDFDDTTFNISFDSIMKDME